VSNISFYAKILKNEKIFGFIFSFISNSTRTTANVTEKTIYLRIKWTNIKISGIDLTLRGTLPREVYLILLIDGKLGLNPYYDKMCLFTCLKIWLDLIWRNILSFLDQLYH